MLQAASRLGDEGKLAIVENNSLTRLQMALRLSDEGKMMTTVRVRTWHRTPKGIEHVLKDVQLPTEIINRLYQWAKKQQTNLLFRKYLSPETMAPPVVEASHTFNQLWKQIQQEGFRSDDERLAASFLHTSFMDNPESIDWTVATKFLGKLERGRKVS